VVVAGRSPKAGATTVAVELAACLAAAGQEGRRWSVTTAANEAVVGGTSLLLTVAAVDVGRVCYLDRGAGPRVAGLIPEDEAVRQAAALRQATVVAFPDAPASRAFRELAAAVVAGS
jgi:cellulose biosynthesis protein BcsQ